MVALKGIVEGEGGCEVRSEDCFVSLCWQNGFK